MSSLTESDLQELKAALGAGGHSLTAARQAVFIALQSSKPLSMSELIKKTVPRIDRASVYRTIGLFEELRIVNRLQTGWKYRLELSDRFQPHHHHMHCTACGATTELPEDKILEQRLAALAAATGFAPNNHLIELRGLCLICLSTQVDA